MVSGDERTMNGRPSESYLRQNESKSRMGAQASEAYYALIYSQ